MSKQPQSPSANNAAKTQPKPTSTTMPATAVVAPEMTGLLEAGTSTLTRSATSPLANPNLHRLQRQMVAGQIGQQRGNGQMQQVLAFVQRRQTHENGQGTAEAPYQSNNRMQDSAGASVVGNGSTVHNGHTKPFAYRSTTTPEADLIETATDEDLADLWDVDRGSGLSGTSEPPPDPVPIEKTGQSSELQRAEAAEANDLPTEAEKKAAKAKAAAARAQATQTQSQGQAEKEKFQARKATETGEKQAAQSKAAAAKAAAPATGEKAGAAANAPLTGSGGRRQQPALNGVGPMPATAGMAAGGAAEKAPTSAAEDPAFQAVTGKVKRVASKEQGHAPADAKAQEAQAAAESPTGEVLGKAQSNQVGEMDAAETPGFDAKAFKAKLMQRIEALTPKDAADADEFKEKNKAGELKGELQSETTAQQEQSQAPLAAATEQAPDTGSVPPKPTTPLQPNTPGPGPAEVDASGAAPKPKSQGEVEAPLQERSQQLDDKMGAANVTEEQLANSNEPEFQAANSARQETQAHATSAPQAYRQDEQSIVTQAQAEATTTAQTEVASMHDTRAGALTQVDGQQAQGKSEDEKKRAEVGDHIQSIYSETQTNVDKILETLDSEVDTLFNEGAEAAKQTFESYVDAEMEAYKEDRYGGWLGWAQWIEDKFQPTQPEILAIFQRGRQTYIQAMNAVIENVVELIGRKLAEAKAAIANGKQKIQEYVANLDPDLRDVGQQAAQEIQSKFDELEQGVDAKQGELIEKLANSYNEKLQAVDARIEELKAENETLYDKAANAIDGVIGTILNLKNMLLGVLARASAAVESIIKDPIGFLGNLVEGVKQGLNGFISNIGTHLKNGFIGWLTGAISGAGITLPETWDLPGIFQLVMQVLGLSFESIMGKLSQLFGFDLMAIIDPVQQVIAIYQEQGFEGLVRAGLARLIGEDRMEALMHVWGIVQNVISGSWDALWGLLSEQLTNLKEMVFGKIEEFLTESVIKAGITWIIGLLNPAGAFIKACKAIYDIVMFFVERGSQIMSLVNAVIDSIGSIASGSLGAAAGAVEQALAKGIPVAIGFLASLLGLGNVSEKVQEIIQSVRGLVDKGINAIFNSRPVQMVVGFIKKLIGKIKGMARSGMNKAKEAMGLGPNPEQKAVNEAAEHLKKKDATVDSVQAAFPNIEAKYQLKKPLRLISITESTYVVQTTAKSDEVTLGGIKLSGEKILIMIREVAQSIYEDEEAKEAEDEIRYTAITDGRYSDEKRKDLADLGEDVEYYDENSKGLETSVMDGVERIGRIRYNREMGKRRLGRTEKIDFGLDEDNNWASVRNQTMYGTAPYLRPKKGNGSYSDLAKRLQAIGNPSDVSNAIQEFVRTGKVPHEFRKHRNLIAETTEVMIPTEGMRTPSSIVTSAMTLELMSSRNDPEIGKTNQVLGWEEGFARHPMTPGRGREKVADSVNTDLGFDMSHDDRGDFRVKPDRITMAKPKEIAAAQQTEIKLAIDWVEAKMKDTNTGPFNKPEQLKTFIEQEVRKFYGMQQRKTDK